MVAERRASVISSFVDQLVALSNSYIPPIVSCPPGIAGSRQSVRGMF